MKIAESDKVREDVSRLITEARDTKCDGLRADLNDRYLGEPYGDERKNRSKFVDTTVSDAVEAVLTDVLDIFTSQEHIAVFKPENAEDVDRAKQETDALHHLFWEENDGFSVLYTWLKEALIQQNSYVWSGWVEQERVTIEEYEDLNIDQLVSVLQGFEGGDLKVLEQDGFGEDEFGNPGQLTDEETGEPMPISIKVRHVDTSKEYLIEPFPQEDFFCTPRHGSIKLDDIPCCGRIHRKRMQEALAMGFSKDSLKEALSNSEDEQAGARHNTQDLNEGERDTTDQVEIYEAYVILTMDDREGLYRTYSAGDGSQLLKWKNGDDCIEEVSRRRISALTPMLMPHRHVGRSIAERVDDIQGVNTVLTRHLLDNLYSTNYGRPHYNELEAGEHTLSDLQNTDHGAPVRTGGALIDWRTPPSVAPTVLPVLDNMKALKEERVGATRYNQGLDAESLNKTATGMGMLLNAGQKKNKLIARTVAETGLTDLFLRMHADMRSGPKRTIPMPLKGEWTDVNPTDWRSRSRMSVAIGMGKGDQDVRRQGHMHLGQVQRELAGSSRMVGEVELYNNIKDAAATFGIDQIEPYVKDPRTMGPAEPQPQPPDPILISAQIEREKLAMDAQTKAQQQQMDHEYRMAQLALKDRELANRIQTDDEKLDLERGKARMADDLARDQMTNQNTPHDEFAQN